MRFTLIVASLVAALAGSAVAGPLTPGNLAVVRIGDGSASLGNSAAATYIDEYTTSGAFVQSIAVPTSANGPNRTLTMAGTGTAMGQLNLSLDGRYLTFGGFDAAVGTASVATTTTAVNNRIIGRLDLAGNIDTSTSITSAFSGQQIRSVFSTDGANYYATGGTSGVQYLSHGAANGVNQLSNVGPTNLRNLGSALGNIYVTSASGATTSGLLQLGSGLPNAPAPLALLPGFSSTLNGTGSFYDFYFADASTAFVANDSAVAGVGGLEKWSLVSGTWTRLSTTAVPAGNRVRQMTGVTTSGVTTLYLTGDNGSSTNSTIYAYTESGGFSNVTLAGTNTVFRGIELIVPAPGALALVGMGGVALARRRRA